MSQFVLLHSVWCVQFLFGMGGFLRSVALPLYYLVDTEAVEATAESSGFFTMIKTNDQI